MKIATKHTSPVDVEKRKTADIRSGDTVRVWQKIKEKDKTRLQAFEGLVIARKHGREAGATFTVRKVVKSIGVEKIFPLYSPIIDHVEVVKRSHVRRAKLYYIREKATREIKKKIRQIRFASQEVISQSSFEEKTEEDKNEEIDKENVSSENTEKDTEKENENKENKKES